MKRVISRGFGKLTPALWRDLAAMARFVQNDGTRLQRIAAKRRKHAARNTRIILAKITGATPDPRRYHGIEPTGGWGVLTRWAYDWEMVSPEPNLAADPDSISFPTAGSATSYTDSRSAFAGTSTTGMGPAFNLLEQNNRETGKQTVDGDAVPGGKYAKVAPGFPVQNSTSVVSTYANYLMPEDWSVQPISINTIVVMYLVRTPVKSTLPSSSSSSATESHNLVPCFQLTNALGRSHYYDGSRGSTCS